MLPRNAYGVFLHLELPDYVDNFYTKHTIKAFLAYEYMSEELKPRPQDNRLETSGALRSIRACDQAMIDFQTQAAESLCVRDDGNLRMKADKDVDAIFSSGDGPVTLRRLEPENAFLNLAMTGNDGNTLTFAISRARDKLFIKFYGKDGHELAVVEHKLKESNYGTFDHIKRCKRCMVDSVSEKGITVRYQDDESRKRFRDALKSYKESLGNNQPGLFRRLLGKHNVDVGETLAGLPLPAHYDKTRVIPPAEVSEIFDAMTTMFKYATASISNQPRIEGK